VDLDFELCDRPHRFRELTGELARHPTLWIDTEVADWFTPSPRLSLVQVRGYDGRLYVFDVLAAGMAEVLNDAFIPGVMASPEVQKWAHSASYERRFLGRERVASLECTLQLARSVPYHRLPVASFSLASLARHLMGADVDKGPQRSDWGVRPLSARQLTYAAADPEWCFRLWQCLADLHIPIDPGADDPARLQARYRDLLQPLACAEAERKAVRAAVQAFMQQTGRARFGGFTVHPRIARKTTLSELVALALREDPGRHYELALLVSRKLRDFIGLRATAVLRPHCTITSTRSFRGPRLARALRPAPMAYAVREDDPARVDGDCAAIDHRRRLLRSERDELRERMKAWLAWKELDGWGEFSFSAPQERWSADVRDLAGLLPPEPYEHGLPPRFMLAFSPAALAELAPRVSHGSILTWRQPRPGEEASGIVEPQGDGL
jgi:hypothetical protein